MSEHSWIPRASLCSDSWTLALTFFFSLKSSDEDKALSWGLLFCWLQQFILGLFSFSWHHWNRLDVIVCGPYLGQWCQCSPRWETNRLLLNYCYPSPVLLKPHCSDCCPSCIVLWLLLLMIMCSSELLIERSLSGRNIRPIIRPCGLLLQGHLLIWPPMCVLLIHYLLFSHPDTGSSCFRPHPCVAQWHTICRWHSQLLVQPHTCCQESLEHNFSLHCQTPWISHQLMTLYGTRVRFPCHVLYAHAGNNI